MNVDSMFTSSCKPSAVHATKSSASHVHCAYLMHLLQDLSGFEAVHLDAHEPQQQHSQQQQYHHSRALSQDRGSSGSPKSAAGRGSGSGGTSSSTSKQGLGVGDNSSSSQASGSPRIAAAGECDDSFVLKSVCSRPCPEGVSLAGL
jgi:hypothetical protein